jgi:hypothetical protein
VAVGNFVAEIIGAIVAAAGWQAVSSSNIPNIGNHRLFNHHSQKLFNLKLIIKAPSTIQKLKRAHV